MRIQQTRTIARRLHGSCSITPKSLWVAKPNSIGALRIVTEPFNWDQRAISLLALQLNCIECFR